MVWITKNPLSKHFNPDKQQFKYYLVVKTFSSYVHGYHLFRPTCAGVLVDSCDLELEAPEKTPFFKVSQLLFSNLLSIKISHFFGFSWPILKSWMRTYGTLYIFMFHHRHYCMVWAMGFFLESCLMLFSYTLPCKCNIALFQSVSMAKWS